jgi:hypothetical protein
MPIPIGAFAEEEPEMIRHGMMGTPEYRAWQGMKARCFRKTQKGYQYYGGRGITVCPEWVAEFATFYAHVGPRPSSDHSLDRIDTNGNYEPGNVRWATFIEQMNNMRNNRIIEFRGAIMTIGQAVRAAGSIVTCDLACIRIRRGWTAEEAVARPAKRHGDASRFKRG